MVSERKQRIREMKDRCNPPEKRVTGPAINNLIYRRIGFLFTRMFIRINATPTQVTWIWGALLMLCSLMFLSTNLWIHVLAAFGWIICFSLDCTDGQIARYKKQYSKRGVFLDLINHSVTWPALFICIGLGLYSMTGEINHVVFAFLAGLFMPLIMVTPDLYNAVSGEKLNRGDNNSVEGQLFSSEKKFKRARDLSPLTFANAYLILLIVATSDLLIAHTSFTFELFWMTNFLSIFVVFYGVFFPLAFFIRVGILYRRLK